MTCACDGELYHHDAAITGLNLHAKSEFRQVVSGEEIQCGIESELNLDGIIANRITTPNEMINFSTSIGYFSISQITFVDKPG